MVVLPWVPEIADRARPFDQLGQRHLAGHDGKTQLPCPLQLGMPGGDGGGDHDGPDTGEVGRVVTLRDPNPQGGQVGGTGGIRIAATHGNPTATRDECERTHPGSADSHEVDSALIRGVEQGHV